MPRSAHTIALSTIHDRDTLSGLIPTYEATKILGHEVQGNHNTTTNDARHGTHRFAAAVDRHAGTADLETDDGTWHRTDGDGKVGQRVAHEQHVPNTRVQGVELMPSRSVAPNR